MLTSSRRPMVIGGVLRWVSDHKSKISATYSSVSCPTRALPLLTWRPGRETFLFPVTWDKGWPVFNEGNPISEHIESVLHDKSPLTLYLNDFSARALDPSFYFIRTPYKPFHTLTARPGYLRLRGNSYALGDRDSAALIVRKQTAYEETFETRLDFKPTSNLTEAGISIYYGDSLHNEIGISGDSAGGSARYIVLRTIVQAQQVGPWALTTLNATVTTVSRGDMEAIYVVLSTDRSFG